MTSIVITGPESTGKTWLCGLLANNFKTSWRPEYLREYYERYSGIEKNQIKKVAERQMQQEKDLLKQDFKIVFFDTNIVSLKIYYEYYFKEAPKWFQSLYEPQYYTHYLLLDTSVPWIKDKQRDSPKVREELYLKFKEELERLNVSYTNITGDYNQRLNQSKMVIKQLILPKT